MTLDKEWEAYMKEEGLFELIQIFDANGCLIELIFNNKRQEIPDYLKGRALICFFPYSEEQKRPKGFLQKTVLTLDQFDKKFNSHNVF